MSEHFPFRSSEALQVILDSMADAYFLHDLQGNLLDVNQIACDMLGYTRPELLALSVFDIVPETSSKSIPFWNDFASQRRIKMLESFHLRKNGNLFPVEIKMSVLDTDDSPCIIVFARDITDRLAFDEDLRLTKFALDHAANATFWYKASNPVFFYVNNAACDYLGYTREELLNMTVFDLSPASSPEILHKHIERLRHEPSVTLDTIHRKKDGEIIPIEALVKLISFGGEEYIISFVRDVSQRKQYELQLQEAKDRAEQADKTKSEFLANMSHEIRTPLTGIIGFSQELLNTHLSDQERAKLAQTIIDNSKHLGLIINDILDLSKIEAHQLEVENVKLSPLEMVKDIASLMKTQAQEKELSFHVDIDFPIPKYIVSDPVRLKQILLNICSNAIKFTQQGEIRLGVQYKPQQKVLTFKVTDTGIGLNESEIEKIFQPFSQADASTTRRFGGTGLGLSISAELAALLGGKIHCTSTKNKGSTFVFDTSTGDIGNMELLDSFDLSIQSVTMNARPEVGARVSGHVLLAEDTLNNQVLINMYLRRAGTKVTIVENGQEAVDAALKENFDLILMDSQMPVLGGLDAIRLLRDQGYEGPIISLTANAMVTDREICIAAGATDYLKKPIDVDDFNVILEKYLKPRKNDGQKEEGVIPVVHDIATDPEFEDIVGYFIEQLPEYVNNLKSFLDQEDWTALKELIHQLKGMGGAFGYQEITDRSEQIEQQLHENNDEQASVLSHQLIDFCEQILK